MNITIPAEVNTVLERIRSAGHEAWICGGCVRDAILGIEPKDWDVTTSARPEDVEEIFRLQNDNEPKIHVVETGIKHGTVTVVVNKAPIEVTTYRIDGEYSDGRRPDQVIFTQDLRQDLARRDFTINAMAYGRPPSASAASQKDGGVSLAGTAEGRGETPGGFGDTLIDPYGGREDLAAGTIRCVGEPEKRFAEDSLRILRALRFAATYGFEIEEKTLAAAAELAPGVNRIARERVTAELSKLLLGSHADMVLTRYHGVLCRALDMKISAPADIDRLPKDLATRLAALEGMDISKLRLDNKTKHKVKAIRGALIEISGQDTFTRIQLKQLMRRYGADAVGSALLIEAGFGAEANPAPDPVPSHGSGAETTPASDPVVLLADIVANNECYSLPQLAVGGDDIIRCLAGAPAPDPTPSPGSGAETTPAPDPAPTHGSGADTHTPAKNPEPPVPAGPVIGRILDHLLDEVIQGRLPNEKEKLLSFVIESYR